MKRKPAKPSVPPPPILPEELCTCASEEYPHAPMLGCSAGPDVELADGTHTGAVKVASATWRRAVSDSLRAGRLEQDLARRTAERDQALAVLAQCERIITSTGGYMEHMDQGWLREARAVLVEHGRRESVTTAAPPVRSTK